MQNTINIFNVNFNIDWSQLNYYSSSSSVCWFEQIIESNKIND